MAAYKASSFLFLSLISLLLIPRLCNCADCHPHDRAVLMEIDRSTNYTFVPSGVNMTENCCFWHIITCNNDRVNGLSLDSRFLGNGTFSGQLPEAIGQLTDLQFLDIGNVPNLHGPLPASMANLRHLMSLDIRQTGLSGPIPEWIGRFDKLFHLVIRDNRQLTGHLPASLAYLRKLVQIEITGNPGITGPIPASFARFVGNRIYLNDNNLSGSIPKSFENARFIYLDLKNNRIEGDMSSIFQNRSSCKLSYVDVSSNRLEFDFSRARFPPSLSSIKLAHNRIYGSIPPWIADQPRIWDLDVSYNRLCGKIPRGGAVAEVPESSYVHNKCLCGPPLPNKC